MPDHDVSGQLVQNSTAVNTVQSNDWDGGYKTVADIAARDAILLAGRVPGELVYVAATDELYLLDATGADLTNNGWRLIATEVSQGLASQAAEPLDPAVRQLYVDPVNGADDNDGLTTGTAFLTIQAAVDAFYRTEDGSIPTFVRGDFRRITVLANGVPTTIDIDTVTIPPHHGSGHLVIEGEVEVLHTDTLAAGRAKVAGNVHRFTQPLTTGGLTANALDQVAFIRPAVQQQVNEVHEANNVLPIIENSVGSVDIIADNSNWLSDEVSPDYVDGLAVEIVRPLVSLRPVEASVSYTEDGELPSAFFVNNGGPLLIKNLATTQAPTAQSKLFLANNYSLQTSIRRTTIVSGIILGTLGHALASGQAVAAFGVISLGLVTTNSLRNAAVSNVIFNSFLGATVYDTHGIMTGVHFVAGSDFRDCTFEFLAADHGPAAPALFSNTVGIVSGMSFGGLSLATASRRTHLTFTDFNPGGGNFPAPGAGTVISVQGGSVVEFTNPGVTMYQPGGTVDVKGSVHTIGAGVDTDNAGALAQEVI